MNETGRRDPRGGRKAWSIATALIGLLVAPSAHAQVATGTILGNVKDSTPSLVVPDAKDRAFCWRWAATRAWTR